MALLIASMTISTSGQMVVSKINKNSCNKIYPEYYLPTINNNILKNGLDDFIINEIIFNQRNWSKFNMKYTKKKILNEKSYLLKY